MGLTYYISSVKSLFESVFPKPVSKRKHERDLEEIERGVLHRHMLSDRDPFCSEHDLSFYGAATDRRLREGRFITQEDADKMKEEAISYRSHPGFLDSYFAKKG